MAPDSPDGQREIYKAMMLGHKRDETLIDRGVTVDESRKREHAIAMAAHARKCNEDKKFLEDVGTGKEPPMSRFGENGSAFGGSHGPPFGSPNCGCCSDREPDMPSDESSDDEAIEDEPTSGQGHDSTKAASKCNTTGFKNESDNTQKDPPVTPLMELPDVQRMGSCWAFDANFSGFNNMDGYCTFPKGATSIWRLPLPSGLVEEAKLIRERCKAERLALEQAQKTAELKVLNHDNPINAAPDGHEEANLNGSGLGCGRDGHSPQARCKLRDPGYRGVASRGVLRLSDGTAHP